jgi:hypothetical protein
MGQCLETAIDGCRFIHGMVSRFFIGSDAPPIHSRRFCIKLMGVFLLEYRDADPAFLADGLRKIKARHLLPLICAAGEMIRRPLLDSGVQANVLTAQALKESIDRIPEQFFLAVPRHLHCCDRVLPLEEGVASIITCYRGNNRQRALSLIQHTLGAVVAPGSEGFEAGVDRLVERIFTRLIDLPEAPATPDEASTWLHRLLIEYVEENTWLQALIRERLGRDRDPVAYFGERLIGTLQALSETSKGQLALAFYQSEFKSLGLDLSFDANFEIYQGGDAAVPYSSAVHADAVLHYVSLLGKIEYFGVDEMMPLLRFVAREAQGEEVDHRRDLCAEVMAIADALKGFGPHYKAKVVAIRDWLEANPFG